MSKLIIASSQTVVAGKFVSQFFVTDEAGNLVGSKAHRTEDAAREELGSLKYYARGLEFARATAAEGASEKSLVGKANVAAAYLIWAEQEEAAAAAPAEEVVAQEAAVEEFDEEEQF